MGVAMNNDDAKTIITIIVVVVIITSFFWGIGENEADGGPSDILIV
jgi:hypothetical protein